MYRITISEVEPRDSPESEYFVSVVFFPSMRLLRAKILSYTTSMYARKLLALKYGAPAMYIPYTGLIIHLNLNSFNEI